MSFGEYEVENFEINEPESEEAAAERKKRVAATLARLGAPPARAAHSKPDFDTIADLYGDDERLYKANGPDADE